MALTREWLQQRRDELRLQIALNEGAIQMIDHCLAEMSRTDGLPVQEFAELVGGPGAKVEGIYEGENS